MTIIGLALRSQAAFANWEKTLNQFEVLGEKCAVHYGKTIQCQGTTKTFFMLPYDESLTVAMPFFSTYNDWHFNGFSKSDPLNKNLPVIAVKLSMAEVNKLPDDLMKNLGVTNRTNVDLFINVQGYPEVKGSGGYENVLFQPHMWAHVTVPASGSIQSGLTINLFEMTDLSSFTFNKVHLDGDQSINSHEKTLSGNTRYVRALANPLDRTLCHIYISTVIMGDTNQGGTGIGFQPKNRVAITIHMLLSDDVYTAISAKIVLQANCCKLSEILNSDNYNIVAFNSLRTLLRNLRDTTGKVAWQFTDTGNLGGWTPKITSAPPLVGEEEELRSANVQITASSERIVSEEPATIHASELMKPSVQASALHFEYPCSYPQWVKIECNTPTAITGLRIKPQDCSGGHTRAPKTFTFEGSHDNSNWATLLSIPDANFTRQDAWKEWMVPNAIAYKYYRIHVTADSGYGMLTIGQLGLLSLPPPVLTGTTLQSSEVQITASSERIVSGEPATIRASELMESPIVKPSALHFAYPCHYPQWVKIECNTPTAITGLRIKPQDCSGGHTRAPKTFTFEGSNDSASWATLLSIPDANFTRQDAWKEWMVPNATAYKYYRIHVTADSGYGMLTIGQLGLVK